MNNWIKSRADFATSSLYELEKIDYKAVFDHAKSGDAFANVVVDHSIGIWSTLVVNHAHTFAPQRIVVGGGIMADASAILPKMRDYVAKHMLSPKGYSVEILAAELGNDAALRGAHWLVEEYRQLVR